MGDAVEWTWGGGGRDAKEMMCTSCTQLIPTAERNTCVHRPAYISLLARLFLDSRVSSNSIVDDLSIKNDFLPQKNRAHTGGIYKLWTTSSLVACTVFVVSFSVIYFFFRYLLFNEICCDILDLSTFNSFDKNSIEKKYIQRNLKDEKSIFVCERKMRQRRENFV